MDINKWKSVAIRIEIVELARKIGKKTERPVSNVFAFAIKQLEEEIIKSENEKRLNNEDKYDQKN